MSQRLYYHDSFLYSFDAAVTEVAGLDDGRVGVVLDGTAFYPTSGGQPFDTGTLRVDGGELRVIDVIDREENDTIVHVIEAADAQALRPGMQVHGEVDAQRRRDHMQQHSGQHVLSAAFVRLFEMPTVSFHLGEESCTIDLTASELSEQQVESAEALANDVVTEDRPVEIRYASPQEAQRMGLRKLPPRSGTIRLIDIRDFDLTACGGTHVRTTGQIGPILLRKVEKVRQGVRVEFICGARAVRASRRDYETLTQAAQVFSTHIHELPSQARKSADELKNASKMQQRLLEQLAEYEARDLVANAPEVGVVRIVERVFGDRDASYAKLVAQEVVSSARAVALVGTTAGQPTIVLAASPGIEINCGALLKQALAEVGGRGGGSREMAQGGVADRAKLGVVMRRIHDVLQAWPNQPQFR